MKYYVSLKIGHRVTIKMADIIKEMELETYEERFPFENESIEVYKSGTEKECIAYIANIQDDILKSQFEITECNV